MALILQLLLLIKIGILHKWDRPDTWNSVFQGFGAGSGIAGGIGLAHNFATTNAGKAILSSLSNILDVSTNTANTIFLTVSYTAGSGFAFYAGVRANNGNIAIWEWDWTNPATYSALVDGFDTGMGWPQNFIEISRGLSKLIKNPKKFGSLLGKKASKRDAIKAILKNPKHPLYKTTTSVVMAYFMTSAANGELDITKWSLSSFSTYEGILNGVFFGKDTANMLKYGLNSKNSQPPKLIIAVKSIVKKWSKKINRMLDNVQVFRKNTEYTRLLEKSFTLETTWRSKLQQLIHSAAIKLQVDNFFKGGFEKFKNGETRTPEILQLLN